jgi:hypothetical protein
MRNTPFASYCDLKIKIIKFKEMIKQLHNENF